MPGQYFSDSLNDTVYNIEQVPSSTWQNYSTNHYYHQTPIRSRHSWSEASSVTTSSIDSDCSSTFGFRTPDIDLSEITVKFTGYSSLLHDSYLKPCDTFPHSNDYQQVYPSVYFHNSLSSSSTTKGFHNECSDLLNPVQQQTLSQDDHYSLLPTLVNENQATYFPERYSEEFYAHTNCDTNTMQTLFSLNDGTATNPRLVQLSKKELIQRVIQLETERSFNIQSNDDTEDFSFPMNQEESDSSSTKIHPCKWIGCDVLSPTLAQLMAHICEAHVGSGKATYACEWMNCIRNKKPFLKRHKMYNHMRTHTGERPFICTIPGCKKTFSRPDSLSTHVKTHSNIRPYLCTIPGCQKAYFHSRSLRKHIKSTHMKNR